MALAQIFDHNVSGTPHRSVKTVCGLISETDMMKCSEDEILENLSGNGVVAVKRTRSQGNGKDVLSSRSKKRSYQSL